MPPVHGPRCPFYGCHALARPSLVVKVTGDAVCMSCYLRAAGGLPVRLVPRPETGRWSRKAQPYVLTFSEEGQLPWEAPCPTSP